MEAVFTGSIALGKQENFVLTAGFAGQGERYDIVRLRFVGRFAADTQILDSADRLLPVITVDIVLTDKGV